MEIWRHYVLFTTLANQRECARSRFKYRKLWVTTPDKGRLALLLVDALRRLTWNDCDNLNYKLVDTFVCADVGKILIKRHLVVLFRKSISKETGEGNSQLRLQSMGHCERSAWRCTTLYAS